MGSVVLQEKTEAEIKQFRKSLKFKATPMPSFYHVAMPSGSDGKKVCRLFFYDHFAWLFD